MRRHHVILVGCFFVFAELLCRLAMPWLVPASGLAAVDLLLGRAAERRRFRAHPYLLYENTPHFTEHGRVQHNALGYRGPEMRVQRQDGVTRILALGGSTTYGWKLEDPREAWPFQLEQALRGRGLRVEVVNSGLPSATSAELLARWIFRDRYLKPDIVIIHGPGNDVWPLMYPGYDPEYTHYRKTWEALPYGRRAGEEVLLSSAVARVAYGWWLYASHASLGIFRDPTLFPALSAQEALHNVQSNRPDGFERNLTLLVRSIQADGAKPLLFKMLRAPKEVFRRLPPAARSAEPLYDAVRLAHEKEGAVVERVAAALSVSWIEIPESTVPLDYFLDHAHLDARGERLKAALLADRMEALISSLPSAAPHVEVGRVDGR